MAVSRPVLLALVGAILAVASAFAATGAHEGATPQNQASIAPAPASRTPPAKAVAPKQASKPGAAKAKQHAAAKHTAAKPEAAKPKAATPKAAKPKAAAPASTTLPKPVARAIAANQTVVLFFRQAGSADDTAAAKAISEVRKLKGVTVASDSLAHLSRYASVVEDLGISQVPAIVIIDGHQKARLVEGYVDAGSLTQQVLDVR